MSIIFLTGNKGKFEEAKLLIPELIQNDIDLEEIQSIDPQVIIAHKLSLAKKQGHDQLVVEDTSLYLDCLNGLPGPLIKWFLKTIGNEGLVKIAKSFGNDRAVAKVVVGLIKEDGEIEFFEGEIKGTVVEVRGEHGFGWDPIFQPEGWQKTFAEMTIEEKNKTSMRKIAFQKLKSYLDGNNLNN